jgi:putative ABC transport system permease protein
MPRNFEFPLNPGELNRSELWVPMSFSEEELGRQTGNWSMDMVGRLKPGTTPAQAQGDAERVSQEIMRSFPAALASIHINAVIRPLREVTVADARPLVRMLFLAVAVVLLIACANLAEMLLVRVIRRQRDCSAPCAGRVFGYIAATVAAGKPGAERERRHIGNWSGRAGIAHGQESAARKHAAHQ